MRHPLFVLPDEDFYELMGRAQVSPPNVQMFEDARKGVPLSDLDRQELLAAWHGVVPTPEGFRWPWPSLDRATGMLPMGDLAVVLAQTGSGKTTFTASLVNQLVQRKTRVLVFATEIPADRYLTALAARKAGLHPDRVVQGLWQEAGWRVSADQARARYEEALYLLTRSTVSIAPHLRLRASQLQETFTQEAGEWGPEVVIVDHFQAITHDLRDGVAAVQTTLELLQDFALTQHCTVIVTNQVHVRGQGGAPPRPTDCVHLAGVFGGQALGQAASQILGVHRVFQPTTNAGVAITPAFLTEYRKANGNESLLWDRSAVAIDLPKIRYDAHGNVGSEIRLEYHNGMYHEPGTHLHHSPAGDADDT